MTVTRFDKLALLSSGASARQSSLSDACCSSRYPATMVRVYAAAAVIGVVLLVASLFGTGHGHGGAHDTGGEHDSPALMLLSTRVWTYLLAFGGGTGMLLHFVAPVAEPTRAVIALTVGVIATALARWLMVRAAQVGPSGTVKRADLVGRVAGVIVPFASGSTGKVRMRVAGSEVDLLATTDDGEPLDSGAEVLILEMRDDGAAVVTRAPGPQDV
jgi:membrane protein implicated in regulation of membrane protease activity